MAYEGTVLDLSGRIDDRAKTELEFRVHRSIYNDPDIYDAEIEVRF